MYRGERRWGKIFFLFWNPELFQFVYIKVCVRNLLEAAKKVVALELSLGPDKHFETHTEGGLCVNI